MEESAMRYMALVRLIPCLGRLLIGLGVVGSLLNACAQPPTPEPPINPVLQALAVTTHSATLTLGAGQQGQQTALCDAQKGENLVSGGYLASVVGQPSDPAHEVDILNSYPSDGARSAPNSQGQTVSGWTVQAFNPSADPRELTVSAICLSGAGVATAVYFDTTPHSCTQIYTPARPPQVGAQSRASHSADLPDALTLPEQPTSGCGVIYQVSCPATGYTALTGGGYIMQRDQGYFFGGTFPEDDEKTPMRYWRVHSGTVNGAVYGVCAKGVHAEPLMVTALNQSSSATTLDVNCPTGTVLVGGGFYAEYYPKVVASVRVPTAPPSWRLRWRERALPQARTLDYGVCVSPPHDDIVDIPIYVEPIKLYSPVPNPQSALSGGDIPAYTHTASVPQFASGALPAVKSISPTGAPIYTVPAGCGDPTPAIVAATNALKKQLGDQLPADEAVFYGPSVTIDRASLTCSPGAGTQQATPFTYVQRINGTGTETAYKPQDARNFQLQRLGEQVAKLGPEYALSAADICPDGLVVKNPGPTQATIECPVEASAKRNWPASQIDALKKQLAGKTPEEALIILNQTPGLTPGRSTIRLKSGTKLPDDPGKITITVIGI
jgi:hypothetical protein